MAGAHGPRAREGRPRPRVLARHAPAPRRRPRLSPRALHPPPRRALHGARRQGDRGPPAPPARGPRRRQNHRAVHPSVAGSPRARLARRAARPRQSRVPWPVHAGDGRRPRLGLRAVRRGLMRLARQVLTIAAKDLRAELRTKEAINASLAFALVILLMFSFAFDPEADTTREISGGLLWIVFAFAGTLILNRSFAREIPNDCLDALVSAPIPGAALFLGKAIANFLMVLAVELVSLPI